MPHRIAFPLTRSAELKVYAPIIIAAIRRNIEVFLLCGSIPKISWRDSPLYRPIKENMRFPGNNKVIFHSYKDEFEAKKIMENNNIEHFIILRYRERELPYQLDLMSSRKYKLHAIQFMTDYLTFPFQHLGKIDTFFVYSRKMISFYQTDNPNANKDYINNKFVPIGNPSFDNLAEMKKNRAAIKKKYGLPPDKPIILFLSLGLTTTFWRKHVFGAPNSLYNLLGAIYCRKWRLLKFLRHHPRQKEIITTIKDWCHANNGVLVVKSRAKQKEPKYLLSQADYLINDSPVWYPYPTLELVSIADLLINFNSTSVMEAAACGVYTISVDLRSDDDPVGTGASFIETAYKNTGVAQQCDYKKLASFLSQHKLSDFSCDEKKQHEFVSTYTGQPNSQAADKILDYILKNSTK